MDLKKRLAKLDRLSRKTVAPDAAPGPREIPDRSPPTPVLTGLGLERRETGAGPVWCRELRDPEVPPCSPVPDLTGLFTRRPDCRPALAEVLLLDTETTGLAGGTGTWVFLLGVSWWRGATLHTRQYFLPGPGDELSLLADLAELAGDFVAVVTFNGASFDLPLLRTRALLNRVPDPLAHLIGWDLLVPARRLWGPRLPDCRQQTVEQAICGRERGPGDIDGARIPQTWFDWLGSGDPGELGQVLTHNHRDMLGMADIFARVVGVARGLSQHVPSEPAWQDRAGNWALGRVCERRQAPDAAAELFVRAWACEWGDVRDPGLRRRFRRDAIRNLKRDGAWEMLEEIIHDGLESEADDVALHREAAILYEHRLVDLERALHHAIAAQDEHRQARLRRRLAARG